MTLATPPNLTDAVILAQHVESPLDLARRKPHNWYGSCHGGDQDPAQDGAMRPMPAYAAYRSPVSGLHLTGACTHPGGSVSGAPAATPPEQCWTNVAKTSV